MCSAPEVQAAVAPPRHHSGLLIHVSALFVLIFYLTANVNF